MTHKLTIQEAAKEYGVKPNTLMRNLRKANVPVEKVNGKKGKANLYRRVDVAPIAAGIKPAPAKSTKPKPKPRVFKKVETFKLDTPLGAMPTANTQEVLAVVFCKPASLKSLLAQIG